MPKVAKKIDDLPPEVNAIINVNHTGTLNLLKQIQFDNLMEGRRITFKK